jgi:hypothetical protein
MPAGAAAVATVAVVAATLVISWASGVGVPSQRTEDGYRPGTPQDRGAGTSAPALASPQAQRRAELDRRFLAARAEHEAGRHVEAFAALSSLADEGHCESARLALLLVHAGPQAYLTSFRAGPKQLTHWRSLPGCWPKAAGR